MKKNITLHGGKFGVGAYRDYDTLIELSKMGSTVFMIEGTDFEIKNNRIFPSVIKKDTEMECG